MDWIIRTSSGRLACPGSPDERLLNRTSGSAARPVLISRASRSSLALYRKVTTWACIREWGKCRVSAPTTIGPRATPHLICRCVTRSVVICKDYYYDSDDDDAVTYGRCVDRLVPRQQQQRRHHVRSRDAVRLDRHRRGRRTGRRAAHRVRQASRRRRRPVPGLSAAQQRAVGAHHPARQEARRRHLPLQPSRLDHQTQVHGTQRHR